MHLSNINEKTDSLYSAEGYDYVKETYKIRRKERFRNRAFGIFIETKLKF